uniref:Anoctamin n=1 Tax=Plectus sambesii TaxID=2011161 RepID=A0A914VUG1_9BILA
MESMEMKLRYADDAEGDGDQRLLSKNGEITIPMEEGRQTRNCARRSDQKCFFADGVRRIDYVLAYELDDDEISMDESESQEVKPEDKKHSRRSYFQTMLEIQGMQLEIADAELSNTRFVLVHAPWEVLAKQAEYLRIKMPIRENDIGNYEKGCVESILQSINTFKIEEKYKIEEPDYFTALFSVERADQFIMPDGDHEKFFSTAQRGRMVHDLLIRTIFDPHRKDRFGIGRLLANGTYTAAYPLHEGDVISNTERKKRVKKRSKDTNVDENDRQLLYDTWARAARFYKYQPKSLIKKYFGARIGLYFAWLGYYTKVLFPAAVVGFLSFIYGTLSLSTDTISSELCNATGAGSIIMCPNCDKLCTFWQLFDSCTHAKLTHMFDNVSTMLFAIFMSVWATLFLEGWKRYHAEIAWEWDLMDYEVEEETIRPEFQLRVSGKCVNPVTQEEEPYLPFYQKATRHFISGVTVVFGLLLVLAFVFGAIVYRVIVLYVLHASDDEFAKTNAPILTGVTAAIINLVVILILSAGYRWIARVLTNWECPRTQTEWDNGYTLKVFLFEFVNCYSSLFYIAFIKGKFSGVPGSEEEDREQGRYRIFGYRPESCAPAGCMVELVIELAVISVGRQFFESFLEIIVPVLCNVFRNVKHHFPGTAKMRERWRAAHARRSRRETDRTISRWEQDYYLNTVVDHFLFDEYLEMVLQFGFVTLFVAAFPLAPLFALLSNLIEIRLDAYKLLVVNQRPMPARAENLGAWAPILDGISKLAVLTNACIIAFTSEFVPKVLYFLTTGNGSYENYINNSLSYYNASKLDVERDPKFDNVTVCRFRDYRKPSCSLRAELAELSGVVDCDDQYGFSLEWWHIFAARVVFVLVFEHLVFLIKGFVAYMIPDIPTHIFIKMQREQYVARQARREYELRQKSGQSDHDGAQPASDHGASEVNVKSTQNRADADMALAAAGAKQKYAAFRGREQEFNQRLPTGQP